MNDIAPAPTLIIDQDHFEIVRTDAEQPFHARLQARNGELTWSTENYTDLESANAAIGYLASLFSPTAKATVYADHVQVWLDQAELGQKLAVQILHLDERTPAPDPDAAEDDGE